MRTVITLAIAMLACTASAQTETDSITYTLDEFVVTVNRSLTTLKGTALVTRVSGTQLEHAGTANDVLKQVPMVLGDAGNFEVFGKGTPAVYVNGRLVQDLSELSQISSGNIKNVEVNTSPGAKYDASVKAVINIRTKAPQGEGFSGLFRAQAGIQKYFRTMDQLNLKYRTGGFEAFANFGLMTGKFEDTSSISYLTRSGKLWHQTLDLASNMRSTDLYGKLGFSYLFNQNHSVGAYYSNGFVDSDTRFTGTSTVKVDDLFYDELTMSGDSRKKAIPRHHANLYYNGNIGKWGIDFNIDYLWRKNRENSVNNEHSGNFENAVVASGSGSLGTLLAQKLVVSHPVWNGGLEFGEEFTSSRFHSDYTTDAASLPSADSQVKESNIAAFVQLAQRFGKWNISAGLRYEHVSYRYIENGQQRDDMQRTYDNIFPSMSISTMLGDAQLALSYTHKTRRPSYDDLDGAISYINRFTLEGGNPYLKPEKIHSVEISGAWRRFFGAISYSYRQNPVLNTTVPYADDGEVKLIIKDNFPKIQKLEAFAGAQFQLGIWQPKVNLGIIKQWLSVECIGGRKSLDNPIGLVQWQNAIHLPADIWLNVDIQWMSAGNADNGKTTSASYLNMKLYRSFLSNRFSVTFEANDIFNKSAGDFTLYSRDVTINRSNLNLNRTFLITLQYTFNTSRDRYRGRGAGNTEMTRF